MDDAPRQLGSDAFWFLMIVGLLCWFALQIMVATATIGQTTPVEKPTKPV